MDPVNLGRSNDKWCSAVPEDLKGFDCLGLESLVNIDDKDCHVSQCPTTCPQGGECVMSWCVDEQQAGNVDGSPHCPAHRSDCFYRDYGRSDVLGNRSDFRTDN
jgi:hypothetical protein